MKIASNTLVKNGMPFIIPVIEQVLPFMERCLITISKYSTDGTEQALRNLQGKNDKIILFGERNTSPGLLTIERQKLLGRTREDWILFLDADDFWPTKSLEGMKELINSNTDAFCFNPYQVVDRKLQDGSWWDRWFTKLFKNQMGVHYEDTYPKENLYKYDQILWWKMNPMVIKSELRFFHLANIMKWRFRDNEFEGKYKRFVTRPRPYGEDVSADLDKIFSYVES